MSSGRLYLLGCDTGDGIDLEGSDVRARRARLCTHDNGVVIEPVGEAPVSLNGRPITVPTRGASSLWRRRWPPCRHKDRRVARVPGGETGLEAELREW